VVVELQWGATVFGEEEGKEVRRFHSVEGGRHSEERRGDQGKPKAVGDIWRSN
jgi:hypothetical protein